VQQDLPPEKTHPLANLKAGNFALMRSSSSNKSVGTSAASIDLVVVDDGRAINVSAQPICSYHEGTNSVFRKLSLPFMSIDTCEGISRLVARHAHVKDEGTNTTVTDNLLLVRYASCSPSIHTTQSPLFGMAVQGKRSIELGGQVHQFGMGGYGSRNLPIMSG
jgi:hypothetical protein